MKYADRWLIRSIKELNFEPYEGVIEKIETNSSYLRVLEMLLIMQLGEKLTKRQAVLLGLLARTYQLTVACLMAKLLQNYSAWNSSFRALMETFFIIEYIKHKPDRYEMYFEDADPNIGKVKAEVCTRYPVYKLLYKEITQSVHVGTDALRLSRANAPRGWSQIPFSATDMNIAGGTLTKNIVQLNTLLEDIVGCLRSLVVENFSDTNKGKILWDAGSPKLKFSCLAYEPKVSS